MYTFTSPNVLLLAGLISLLASCTSPMKLTEQGRYEAAIDKTIQKLAGKNNKNPKHVEALELAFQKITQRDMDMIEQLRTYERAENWPKVHAVLKRIDARQREIEALLPLHDKNGQKADFLFVNTGKLLAEAKEKAALYHYDKGVEYLRKGQAGDKQAARLGYEELGKTREYFSDYRNTNELRQMASSLGIVYITLSFDNQSHQLIPRELEQELAQLPVANLNSQWKIYHNTPKPDVTYDYRYVIRLRNIDISPERVEENNYRDECVVEDGFEYVLDERGNVAKDTLGNDIKRPRKVTISAQVQTVRQIKLAVVDCTVDLIHLGSNELVNTRNLRANTEFSHVAGRYFGDARALSKQSRTIIGNAPLPFPNNEEMVQSAFQDLKPMLASHIRSKRIE